MAKATDSNNKTNLQRDAVGRPLSMRDARGNKFSARKYILPQKNLQALLLSGKNVLRAAGMTVKKCRQERFVQKKSPPQSRFERPGAVQPL
jgi:hypothetical protein